MTEVAQQACDTMSTDIYFAVLIMWSFEWCVTGMCNSAHLSFHSASPTQNSSNPSLDGPAVTTSSFGEHKSKGGQARRMELRQYRSHTSPVL